jgi:hypothetical protein
MATMGCLNPARPRSLHNRIRAYVRNKRHPTTLFAVSILHSAHAAELQRVAYSFVRAGQTASSRVSARGATLSTAATLAVSRLRAGMRRCLELAWRVRVVFLR